MAAAIPSTFFLLLILLLSSPFLAFSHLTSPSPSPKVGPIPAISSILPSSPYPISSSPEISASPPAPPADDESPSSSPSPSYTPSPTPSPSAIGVSRAADSVETSGDRDEKGSGGTSAGKKVGVAFGVIVAAAFVVLGVVVYRKRQENLRRARYGINARMMEMI